TQSRYNGHLYIWYNFADDLPEMAPRVMHAKLSLGIVEGLFIEEGVICEDGEVGPGEECDGSITSCVDSYGGSPSDWLCMGCMCIFRGAICGNAILESGEECDWGDPSNPDFCMGPGEECNSDTVPNACRTDCRLAHCGDGVVDAGEECDRGANNGVVCDSGYGNPPCFYCNSSCEQTEFIGPNCGDGIVQEEHGEECETDDDCEDGEICINCNCIDSTITHSVTITKRGEGFGAVVSTPEGIECGTECTSYSFDFPIGTVVHLDYALPECSAFVGWEGCDEISGDTCIVTVAADTEVIATFDSIVVVRNMLTVARTWGGVVVSTPGGIDCGNDRILCRTGIPSSHPMVTLTATPNIGRAFSHWVTSDGSCSTAEPICIIRVDSDKEVTPVFRGLSSLNLSVVKTGYSDFATIYGGGIYCGPSCTRQVSAGSEVLLSTGISPGYTVSWEDGCDEILDDECYIGPMFTDKIITANVAQNPKLQVVKTGSGSLSFSPLGTSCGTYCYIYTRNTNVRLTTTPVLGYRIEWIGCDSVSEDRLRCDVNMDSDKTVYLNHIFDSTTLTVVKTGPGRDSAVVTGGGINCGTTCTNSGSAGRTVALSASALGYTVSWSGCDSLSTDHCFVTMNSDKVVTANFEPTDTKTLTVQKSGTCEANARLSASPFINCGSVCSWTYNLNTGVNVFASYLDNANEPPTCCQVSSWTGCRTASGDSCAVIMDGDKTVKANFETVSYHNLKLTVNGPGSVRYSSVPTLWCDSYCTKNYCHGTTTTLSASPNSGYKVIWSGCDSYSGNQCYLTFNSDKAVTATFVSLRPILTVVKTGPGADIALITSSPSGINCGSTCVYSYDSGNIYLTPSQFTGYNVVWTGCDSVLYDNRCVVALVSDRTVTANFQDSGLPTYTLTYTRDGVGSLWVSPAGTSCGSGCAKYNSGQDVRITASSATGYSVSWSGCDSYSENSCYVTMDSDKIVTAKNIPLPKSTLSVSKTGSGLVLSSPSGINCGSTCSFQYNTGISVTLTASPSVGYKFDKWENACSGSGGCTVLMNTNKYVRAVFVPVEKYTLSVSKPTRGYGTITGSGIVCGDSGSICSSQYNDGTHVTLTANLAPGATILGWSGCDSYSGTSCTVTMNSAKSVSANIVCSSCG
ncbi:hypothetical protein KO465_02185, partial [Candidatus Micrarchaeota archaeon]|nr:hypothetical protein [Candidatus Micrarchaeota archaeon]